MNTSHTHTHKTQKPITKKKKKNILTCLCLDMFAKSRNLCISLFVLCLNSLISFECCWNRFSKINLFLFSCLCVHKCVLNVCLFIKKKNKNKYYHQTSFIFKCILCNCISANILFSFSLICLCVYLFINIYFSIVCLYIAKYQKKKKKQCN